MDAVIKIPSSEFNEEIFKTISALIKGKDAEITIAVRDRSQNLFRDETEEEYWNRLNRSISDIEQEKGVTFTMQELENLIHK
jgi:hypothetical protein